jgi:hypothetical protein
VRLSFGVSQRYLSAVTGIAQANLSQVERGGPCWPDWRRRIAMALGVSEDALFGNGSGRVVS